MNYRGSGMSMVTPFTPMVKKLVIVTLVVWIVGQLILGRALDLLSMTSFFGLIPGKLFVDFYFWQPMTYLFLHSLDWTHIVFNMLMLWWLGAQLEQLWGGRYFLFFYLMSGIGAGVFYSVIMIIYSYFYSGSPIGLLTPVIGASGAIFGLLIAYGKIFGDQIIAFMMLFPMPAKYFVMLLGGIQIVALLGSSPAGEGVAYLAHLMGLVSGYILLIIKDRRDKRATMKKRGRNLRLVVDNDVVASGENKKGPKYWN